MLVFTLSSPDMGAAAACRPCADEQRGAIAAAEPHLLDATRKQLELSRALPADTRRRRVISWLQRRGHSWDTISKLLQQTELARQ